MKIRNWGIMILALLGVILVAGACEKDPIVSCALDETIIIENRSGVNGVRIYIDDQFKGIVDNGKDLVLKGDYGGKRKFYAYAESPAVYWPTFYEDVPENGVLTLTLISPDGPGARLQTFSVRR